MLTPNEWLDVQSMRLDIEFAIQNLCTELSNLEKWRGLFDKEDEPILKACNTRLNELLFDTLSRNSVTNLRKCHEV